MEEDVRISRHRTARINVLRGLEPVRRRPELYLGPAFAEHGPERMLAEIVSGALTEESVDSPLRVEVSIDTDERVTVADNGPGLSANTGPDGTPRAQAIVTRLFAPHAPRRPVQPAMVNALSSWFALDTTCQASRLQQRYERGVLFEHSLVAAPAQSHETTIRFVPDREILRGAKLPLDLATRDLETLLPQTPALRLGYPYNPDATIRLTDARSGQEVLWTAPAPPPIQELAGFVRFPEQLGDFGRALWLDYRRNGDQWAQGDIGPFLDAASAWLTDGQRSGLLTRLVERPVEVEAVEDAGALLERMAEDVSGNPSDSWVFRLKRAISEVADRELVSGQHKKWTLTALALAAATTYE